MAQLTSGALCALHTDTPATFVCDRCGSFACAGCHSVLEQGELCQACGERARRDAVPWERWRELGAWTAFWQTVKRVSFAPDTFFEAAAHDRGVFGAMLFGTIAYLIPTIVHAALYAIVLAVVLLNGRGLDMPGLGAGEIGVIVGIIVISLIQFPFYGMLGIAIGAGLTHLCLKVFGRATASFEQTLRAVAYANGAYAFGGIPCLGLPIGLVWMVVAEARGIRAIHKCSTGMAVLSTAGYRVLFWGLGGAAYALFIIAMIKGRGI